MRVTIVTHPSPSLAELKQKMARVDGKSIQGIRAYMHAPHHAEYPPRPPLYGELSRTAPICTTLDRSIVEAYMRKPLKPPPEAVYSVWAPLKPLQSACSEPFRAQPFSRCRQ